MKIDYDEVSPLTGNLCVITECDEETNVTSYMCMESGFTTTEHMKIDSDMTQTYEEQITDLMRNSKFEDTERGLVWYPSFLNINGIGMLYPVGTSREDLKWEVTRIVPLIGEERKKYPIPGKDNEYYTSKLDVENAERFDANEFEAALDRYYIIAAEVYNEMTTNE